MTAYTSQLRYAVATLRAAGLEAKWARTRRGAPIIKARDPGAPTAHQRESWWLVDAAMWDRLRRAHRDRSTHGGCAAERRRVRCATRATVRVRLLRYSHFILTRVIAG